MKKTPLIAAFIALTVIVSCDNKKGMLAPTVTPISAEACDSIRYTNGVKVILDKNCSCHSGPFANAGVDLSTYAGASGFSLDVKKRITNANNPMPPSGLMSQAKVDSILCWVNKGAPL